MAAAGRTTQESTLNENPTPSTVRVVLFPLRLFRKNAYLR